MKKMMLVLVLLAVNLMCIPACDKGDAQQVLQVLQDTVKKNKTAICAALKIAGREAAYRGFQKLAVKSPDTVKEAAAALSKNLKEQIIPYFSGQQLGSAAEVEAILESSLCKDVPDEVKNAIIDGAAVLDIYLPIPDGSGILPTDGKDFILAFLNGIPDGLDKFQNNTTDKTPRFWLKQLK